MNICLPVSPSFLPHLCARVCVCAHSIPVLLPLVLPFCVFPRASHSLLASRWLRTPRFSRSMRMLTSAQGTLSFLACVTYTAKTDPGGDWVQHGGRLKQCIFKNWLRFPSFFHFIWLLQFTLRFWFHWSRVECTHLSLFKCLLQDVLKSGLVLDQGS